MRVYIPATLPQLATVIAEGGVGSPPFPAFAVTPGLREWYVEGDLEELEYAAMTQAAEASLRLLAADPAAPRRRVVLAADVPDGNAVVDEDLTRGAVVVVAAVPLDQVASVHVDEPDAEGDVGAAADAVTDADRGDDDADVAVGAAAGHELLWYATQEIPDLLA